MARIKLIKSLSFSDGTITAKRTNPVVEVPDESLEHYLNTGFFSADDAETMTGEPEQEKGEEEFPFPLPEPKPTEAEKLRAKLAEMSIKELKAYAAEHGIDLEGASKKDVLISRIEEAEEKAAEARAALRAEKSR